MKILGVGVDLVSNLKIQKIITKSYSERFLRKFLHQEQLLNYLQLSSEESKVQFVASRWAVKEALAKAIGKKQLIFNQMKIIKDAFGKPHMRIEGDQNEELVRELKMIRCHISITHELEYTVGYAIAEHS